MNKKSYPRNQRLRNQQLSDREVAVVKQLSGQTPYDNREALASHRCQEFVRVACFTQENPFSSEARAFDKFLRRHKDAHIIGYTKIDFARDPLMYGDKICSDELEVISRIISSPRCALDFAVAGASQPSLIALLESCIASRWLSFQIWSARKEADGNVIYGKTNHRGAVEFAQTLRQS